MECFSGIGGIRIVGNNRTSASLSEANSEYRLLNVMPFCQLDMQKVNIRPLQLYMQ